MPTLTFLLLALVTGPQEAVVRPPAETPPAPREQTAAPSGYTYNAEGRRDPFVSLVVRVAVAAPPRPRAPGVPGLRVNEVAVTGIMRSRAEFIAMIQSSDGKTYIVHGGDQLFDGAVARIAKDEVIFTQAVEDSSSRLTRREVAKRVRAADKPEEPARRPSREPNR